MRFRTKPTHVAIRPSIEPGIYKSGGNPALPEAAGARRRALIQWREVRWLKFDQVHPLSALCEFLPRFEEPSANQLALDLNRNKILW
jgi:hypothetical protein